MVPWDVIIITAGNEIWREAIEKECSVYQANFLLPEHVHFLVITDPQNEKSDAESDSSVGSGGATINAILVAAETLSARKGRSMINSDDLHESRVLLVHSGRPSSQRWLIHNYSAHLLERNLYLSENSDLLPLSLLCRAIPWELQRKLPWTPSLLLASIWNASLLAPNFQTGVWVSSVECGLIFPQQICGSFGVQCSVDTSYSPAISPNVALHAQQEGALICTVCVPVRDALYHGLVITDDASRVKTIIYRPTLQQCQSVAVDGKVSIASGQLFFSSAVCDRLLALHTLHPFTHCTYHATDSDLMPFSVSLYFEIVCAMCSGASHHQFVGPSEDDNNEDCNSMKYAMVHYEGKSASDRQLRLLARECAWKMLSDVNLTAHLMEKVDFCHINSMNSFHQNNSKTFSACLTEATTVLMIDSCFLPDQIETYASDSKSFTGYSVSLSHVISRSGPIRIGAGSCLIGLDLGAEMTGTSDFGSGFVWQQCDLPVSREGLLESFAENDANDQKCNHKHRPVVTCHGVMDDLALEYPHGGMFNRPWKEVLELFQKSSEELWPVGVARTPMNARLFQVNLKLHLQIARLQQILRIEQEGCHDSFDSSGIHEDCEMMSLAEVSRFHCPISFIEHQQEVLSMNLGCYFLVSKPKVRDIQLNNIFHYFAVANRARIEELLDLCYTLLDVRRHGTKDVSDEYWLQLANATRLLAASADIASALAGWQGNIRTGPASNPLFEQAFKELQNGSLMKAVDSLQSAYRALWRQNRTRSKPWVLVRMARHLQRAVHLLIARQVLESVEPELVGVRPIKFASRPVAGEWVEAQCPGRLDLAGGWTDTPPICFIQGGAVLNVAIKVNGENPITVRGRWNRYTECGESCSRLRGSSASCTARNAQGKHSGVTCLLRSVGSKLAIHCDSESGSETTKACFDLESNQDARAKVVVQRQPEDDEQVLQLRWSSVKDFEDYGNPIAAGALVKAALVYTRLVCLDSDEDLDEQLCSLGDGWLELEICSMLPPGSGLGGSSLVAGALLSVLAVLVGHSKVSVTALIHATLGLEQLMTTGGGWQDQVGGLYGGLKLGVSEGKLPVKVESYNLNLSGNFTRTLNDRLLLLYTGQVRLAKNLLQSVVRSWYSGDILLSNTFHDLRLCALDAAKAAVASNVEDLGAQVNKYWSLKKLVAQGSEPFSVTKLLKALEPHLCGASLAGAGGGGYLYAFLKPEASVNGKESVCSILQEFGLVHDAVEVTDCGLLLTMGDDVIMEVGCSDMSLDGPTLEKLYESAR